MNENKKTVLISVGILAVLTIEELHKDDGELFQIERQIEEAIEELEATYHMKWQSTGSVVLDPERMNCGLCSTCSQWTTDREKPNAILELCYGATVEGKLLCDDCLPKGHRWAF